MEVFEMKKIINLLFMPMICVTVIMLVFVTGAHAAPGIGEIIQFGGYDWRVLDEQGGKALIITNDVIERRFYNDKRAAVTWETCSLREYLNGEFYAKFTKEEQERIAETRVNNSDNLWYGSSSGGDTTDKVFLLSFEEADKYFGDSGDYLNKRRKKNIGQYPNNKWVSEDNGSCLSNANDNDRIAKYDDEASWWWLRSPGYRGYFASIVDSGGNANAYGVLADRDDGGIRPALWINL